MDRPGVHQVPEGSEEHGKIGKLVTKSSKVPQWPSQLRNRWDDDDEPFCTQTFIHSTFAHIHLFFLHTSNHSIFVLLNFCLFRRCTIYSFFYLVYISACSTFVWQCAGEVHWRRPNIPTHSTFPLIVHFYLFHISPCSLLLCQHAEEVDWGRHKYEWWKLWVDIYSIAKQSVQMEICAHFVFRLTCVYLLTLMSIFTYTYVNMYLHLRLYSLTLMTIFTWCLWFQEIWTWGCWPSQSRSGSTLSGI